MNNDKLQCYYERHPHFYSLEAPAIVEELLANKNTRGLFTIADLGCGDGRALFALQQKGLLNNATNIIGVDFSELRIRRFIEKVRGAKGIVSDVCSIKELESNSFDFIICSQVIEHVSDDRLLVKEIARLLKENGCAYISSVIKRWYGIWIYRKGGQFRLDPTHVREYSSKNEFLGLFEKEPFKVVRVNITPNRYSVIELVARALVLMGIISAERISKYFIEISLLRALRKLHIPVLGYSVIETVCQKEQS